MCLTPKKKSLFLLRRLEGERKMCEDRRAVAGEAVQTGGGRELVARWRRSHGTNRVSEKALVT